MKPLKKNIIFVLTSALLASGLTVGSSAAFLVTGASGGGNGVSWNCAAPQTQGSNCPSGSDWSSVLGNLSSSCPTAQSSGGVRVITGSAANGASLNQTIQAYLDAAGQKANCNTQSAAASAGQNSNCPTSASKSTGSCPTSSGAVTSAPNKAATTPAAEAASTGTAKAAAQKPATTQKPAVQKTAAAKTEAAATKTSAAPETAAQSGGTAAAAAGKTSSCNTSDKQYAVVVAGNAAADNNLLEYINSLLEKCGIDLGKIGVGLPDSGNTTPAQPTQPAGGTGTDTPASSGGSGSGGQTTAPSGGTGTGSQSNQTADNQSFEKQVVALVNEQRAANGLKPLTLSTQLSNAARTKSQDMHDNHYFAHESPTYGSPFDMLSSFGISYRAAGENIAMGYATPEAVMNAWMNSSGHRANILNSAYTQIGVGYVADGNYWTQEFIG